MRNHFISNFLTHWTGKDKDDTLGLKNLESIVSLKRLWLNYCPHFRPVNYDEANLRMVCFTDIPHYLSKEHCSRYGKFGISFKKDNLINYGANPVLYLTENKKDDATNVYDFICELVRDEKYNVPKKYIESLERFFGFSQDYKKKKETYYYEREWRILGNNLTLIKEPPVSPGKAGIIKIDSKEQYFLQFDENDIEFLICPKQYAKELTEKTGYPVTLYEYLIL